MFSQAKFLVIGAPVVPMCDICSVKYTCSLRTMIDVQMGDLNSLTSDTQLESSDGVQALIVANSLLKGFLAVRSHTKDDTHLSRAPYFVALERSHLGDEFRLPHSAVDFISLPFCPAELKRRFMENIRSAEVKLKLFPKEHLAEIDGAMIQFTNAEFKIMALLHDAGTNGATRLKLVAAVWPKTKVCSKTLDVHISGIRKKINPLSINVFFRSPDVFALAWYPAKSFAAKAPTKRAV